METIKIVGEPIQVTETIEPGGRPSQQFDPEDVQSAIIRCISTMQENADNEQVCYITFIPDLTDNNFFFSIDVLEGCYNLNLLPIEYHHLQATGLYAYIRSLKHKKRGCRRSSQYTSYKIKKLLYEKMKETESDKESVVGEQSQLEETSMEEDFQIDPKDTPCLINRYISTMKENEDGEQVRYLIFNPGLNESN